MRETFKSWFSVQSTKKNFYFFSFFATLKTNFAFRVKPSEKGEVVVANFKKGNILLPQGIKDHELICLRLSAKTKHPVAYFKQIFLNWRHVMLSKPESIRGSP